MELAGVARLVHRPDLLDGQLSAAEAAVHTEAPGEAIRHAELAVLPVGGHSGGVALLGRLLPQHLLHPLREAVAAGEGGRLPAHHRLVALCGSFTWHTSMRMY